MRFKINLKDGTVIYVNNICFFGIGTDRLTLWSSTKDHDSVLIRAIPVTKVGTVYDDGLLIYV